MLTAILLVSALMSFATLSGLQAPLFAPAPGSPLVVGSGSGTIIFGDVNADGRLDMLTRHLQTRLVTIQIGNGRGGFRAAPQSPVSFTYAPGDMALGDLNKDGIPDLAVTPGDRDIVDVFIGNGHGGFTKTEESPVTVSTSIEPYNKRTLRLLDINEDGNLDVVTANGRRQNAFGVLYGNGRGTFTQGPTVQVDSGRDGYSLAFGDFDRDGHLDVVNASRAIGPDDARGRVVVQFGDGHGRFSASPQSPMPVDSAPRAVAVADMNGDRRPDIALWHATGALSVLLNDGRRGFAPAPGSPFRFGIDAFALNVADVNRDGKLDVMAATVNSVTVLLGDGRGYSPCPGSPFPAGPGAYNLGVADVNEDGKLDVAASSFEGDAVTLLLGR